MKKNTEDKIKCLDKKITELIEKNKFSILKYITATNKEQEKKKFLSYYKKKIIYNPKYKYKKIPKTLIYSKENKLDKKIKLLLQDKNLKENKKIFKILRAKVLEIKTILNLIRNIGTNKITKYSKKLYGRVSKRDLKDAKIELEKLEKNNILKQNKKDTEKKYLAEDAKKQTDKIFKRAFFKGWITKIVTSKKINSRFKVNNKEKILYINKNCEPFSKIDILKLIEHEIKVHIQRFANAEKFFLKSIKYGSSNYLKTEEGLASLFEVKKKVKDKKNLKTSCLYVIVSGLAETKSFYKCFNTLIKKYKINENTAYNIVARIKRGLSDTSKPGGFFKDHVYFTGYNLVKNLKQETIDKLFKAKIGVEDLKNLSEII